MEKEIERQKLENEKNQREIDEMKRQLSQLATAASSSNLQVNLFQNSLYYLILDSTKCFLSNQKINLFLVRKIKCVLSSSLF